MIGINNVIVVLLVSFVFGSCIANKDKMKNWSIEFSIEKKYTLDSYYVNSKGEGIRMVRDVDCNVQLEKYDYEKEEKLKIYNAILSLQKKNIDWDCSNDNIKDGVNAKILFREGQIERIIELPYCVIEQHNDDFMNIVLLFESIVKDKKIEVILESHVVPPPPLPN
ncbi:hypothetical protein [Myroides sp. DF42-4-2]|uniref:hypothetical protein n=1 Tax=unclassified Myroides TaxID=2642485 RepID=UPI002577B7B5|nr:hypothetical protein [Myroides sp. DF42-4-2]MDM1407521.1 hypothetical protein [Myroides sp. DF42-4-2]